MCCIFNPFPPETAREVFRETGCDSCCGRSVFAGPGIDFMHLEEQ
jgi:hypothetical protein